MKHQCPSYAQHGTLSQRIAAVSATSAGGAPIGLSGLDDNREETYKPYASSNAATLAVQAGPTLVSGSTADNKATAFREGGLNAGVQVVVGSTVLPPTFQTCPG